MCLQTNLEDAYRHYSMHAAKNIDKKEICQCGLIFPSFTLLELNVYRQVVEKWHRYPQMESRLIPEMEAPVNGLRLTLMRGTFLQATR